MLFLKGFETSTGLRSWIYRFWNFFADLNCDFINNLCFGEVTCASYAHLNVLAIIDEDVVGPK